MNVRRSVIGAVGVAAALTVAGCGSTSGQDDAGSTPAAHASVKPHIGGTAKAVMLVKFTKPGRMVAGTTGPSAEIDYRLSPARAVAGTKVTVRYEQHYMNEVGHYSYRIGGDVPSVSLYAVPPAGPKAMPSGHGVNMKGPCTTVKKFKKVDVGHGETAEGDARRCVFTVPSAVKPGRYLVSPAIPPRVTEVTVAGKKVSPASVGATTSGSLPMVTIQG